jgi:hypothetical protein
MQCEPSDAFLSSLKNQYNEVPAFSADANGHKMTLTLSPGGTWTLLVSVGDDGMCMVAAGDSWKPEDQAVPVVPNVLPAPMLLPYHQLRI